MKQLITLAMLILTSTQLVHADYKSSTNVDKQLTNFTFNNSNIYVPRGCRIIEPKSYNDNKSNLSVYIQNPTDFNLNCTTFTDDNYAQIFVGIYHFTNFKNDLLPIVQNKKYQGNLFNKSNPQDTSTVNILDQATNTIGKDITKILTNYVTAIKANSKHVLYPKLYSVNSKSIVIHTGVIVNDDMSYLKLIKLLPINNHEMYVLEASAIGYNENGNISDETQILLNNIIYNSLNNLKK